MTPDPKPAAGGIRIECPNCGAAHIDEGEWATHPHRTHQCQSCGHAWRPFLYATVGVAPEAAPNLAQGYQEDGHEDSGIGDSRTERGGIRVHGTVPDVSTDLGSAPSVLAAPEAAGGEQELRDKTKGLVTEESVYCSDCESVRPVHYDHMKCAQKQDKNNHDATDILCDSYHIVATLHHPSPLAKFLGLKEKSNDEEQCGVVRDRNNGNSINHSHCDVDSAVLGNSVAPAAPSGEQTRSTKYDDLANRISICAENGSRWFQCDVSLIRQLLQDFSTLRRERPMPYEELMDSYQSLQEDYEKLRRERDKRERPDYHHIIVCNYHLSPIGDPGCICEVNRRGSLAKAEAQLRELTAQLERAKKLLIEQYPDPTPILEYLQSGKCSGDIPPAIERVKFEELQRLRSTIERLERKQLKFGNRRSGVYGTCAHDVLISEHCVDCAK